ncbi:uncharacterized protein LOC101846058, partial [Aplysia californica]|uniref:Uncharacterized protein LOC101846058 n=1 Tax=Aplysia californica TaxID=6500 RepID=A0ABM0ZUI9_APLCA
MELKGFDLDEMLDRLDGDDIECLTNFVSDVDEEFLCRRFAHRSSGIFSKIMAAGADCEDVLLSDDDDDDDDDHLDESHQMAILRRYRGKPKEEWTDDDINKIVRLAPDVIDDDLLDDLPSELLQRNMHHFGRLAARRGGNPRLRYALRERVDELLAGSVSTDDIRQIGAGLLSLRLDQIEELDGDLLLEIDPDDILDDYDDDDDDSPVTPGQVMKLNKRDDDDDDDDDDDGLRLALGRRMKHSLRQAGAQPTNLGRALRYLHDDLDFVRGIEPDDLMENLADFRDLDFDDDDAHSLFSRLSQASQFPPPSQMTGQLISGMGHLMRGMGVSGLAQLNKTAIQGAMMSLRDVEFDDDQAEEILEDVFDDLDIQNFGATDIRNLGKLSRGLSTDRLETIHDSVMNEVLDDLDDLDLTEAQRKIINYKARMAAGNRTTPHFLATDDFAEVLSLDDLDDLTEDEVKDTIAHSAKVNWRLPQAAALAMKYKMANGGKRLRPSDLAIMGHVARGLLPEHLDEMADSQDDVLDLVEELKDIQDELTSAQIDGMVSKFNMVSDLDNKEVLIDETKALQAAHVLAYLKPDHFEKLEFSDAGKMAFVSQVAKMSTRNMPRTHIQFLARKMLDMIEETSSAESTTESAEEKDSRSLRSLGQMSLGLTTSQIRRLTGQAVFDNLDILRTLPLTAAQARALLKSVDDWSDDWECRGDYLARLGPLLQHNE